MGCIYFEKSPVQANLPRLVQVFSWAAWPQHNMLAMPMLLVALRRERCTRNLTIQYLKYHHII